MAPRYPPDHWRDTGYWALGKLKSYWKGEEAAPPPPPPITETTALLCAILFTFAYIAPFYLSPTLRTSSIASRDSPAVISARIRAVIVTCIGSTLFTIYILNTLGGATAWDILRLMALWPVNMLDIMKVLGLLMILFSGPLYETLIVDGDWRDLTPGGIKDYIWTDPRGLRNIVVAPVSEELVFRSLTISLYLLARATPYTIVVKTPLIFGLAHIHHLAAFMQTYTPADRTLPPLKIVLRGLLVSGFQFSYTSLFGIFAAFVYIRTGNVWAAILAHSFCNKMGVPRLWGRLGQYTDLPMQGMTPDVAQGKKEDDSVEMKGVGGEAVKVEAVPQNLGIQWTVVYYVLIGLGSLGFYTMLMPLTESSNALVKI